MNAIPRLLVIAAVAALAACGNKGPLVLPSPPSEAPAATEPAAAEPVEQPAIEPADAEASDPATPPVEPPATPPVPESDGNG